MPNSGIGTHHFNSDLSIELTDFMLAMGIVVSSMTQCISIEFSDTFMKRGIDRDTRVNSAKINIVNQAGRYEPPDVKKKKAKQANNKVSTMDVVHFTLLSIFMLYLGDSILFDDVIQ